MDKMSIIVTKLTKLGKTISTMESCTGGFLASSITDIEGSSAILKYSAVTYSNEFKIKMGVDEEVISKYSVYSKETSVEMARKISLYTNSNYGVGITGKLNRLDENNPYGNDNEVFYTIYDKDSDKCYTNSLVVSGENRNVNKKYVVEKIVEDLINIIK